MSEPILEIEDVVIRAVQSGTAVIDRISLTVAKGEVVALIGASGSGKTTLALSALGHLRPGLELAGGRVRLDGSEMTSLAAPSLRRLRGRAVAYVAQSAAAAFNPRMRLDPQVTEPSRVHGTKPRSEALRVAWEHYGKLDLPDTGRIGSRFPHEVSGGQLQRFMIAMGLQESPLLLVCDEPTSALDVTTQVEVLRSLKRGIRDEGTAALFVSHDLAVVAQIADRIAVLRGGRLVEIGTTRQILSAPREPYTRELLGAFRPLTAGKSGTARPDARGKPLLGASRIVAGFGSVHEGRPAIPILNDVSLEVSRGRISAVIGESGSGKSTLASVLAGLHPQALGEVVLDGRPLAPAAGDRTLDERRRIQLVFQSADTSLNGRHTVGRILGRVLRFFRPTVGAADRDRRIAELLEMVHLPAAYAGRLPRQMSGGEKQRVNLARALAAEPDVIICDEITSALDTMVAEAIIRLVADLRDRVGLGIVFISHDLATVASLADDVTVLRHGCIVEHGTTADVLAHPQSAYTRLLISSVPQLRIGWLEDAVAARAEHRQALGPDAPPALDTATGDVAVLPDDPAVADAASAAKI